MTEPPGSATDERPTDAVRRAAAGPASPDATAAEAMTMTVPVDGTSCDNPRPRSEAARTAAAAATPSIGRRHDRCGQRGRAAGRRRRAPG